ncbi:MAG: hypothetical protein AMXMBFR80_19110 [Dehalococcoidia bacterium]|jgi:hypothetical protein|nr:zinc ribbon domain-containing protein [Tepidiformaceae bacterium]
MFCASCGATLRPQAAFCDSCGAAAIARGPAVPARRSRSSAGWVAGGIAAGLAIVAVGAVVLLTGDDDGHEPAIAAPPESVLRTQGILDSLPDLEGETDLDQMRALLGPPDAFSIFLDQYADGSTARREEWFYYEFYSMYEFVDGRLVANLPLDDPAEWHILPRQYDPAMFQLGETWGQVAERIPDPGSLTRFELEPQYELPASYYVGNQLVLLFDEHGGLLYVEAVPLEPGEEPPP